MTKFIEYYSQTLFPTSPIILILCSAEQFMTSHLKRQKFIEPAYTAFLSLNTQPGDVLVHIFSNGGVSSFKTLVSLMPGKEFSPRVLVIDSAPGKGTLKVYVAAFTAEVKSPITKFFMSIFLVLAYIVMIIKDWIFRREDVLSVLRRWLTDDGNGIGKSTKRVFLYSDMDELVQKESVEEHICELKERGYDVRSRNFGDSRHVGHMRAYPEEYWREIMNVWKE